MTHSPRKFIPAPLEDVVNLLESLGKRVVHTSGGYTAQCPAHDDRNPSLKLQPTTDGQGTTFHCFAACTPAEIRSALSDAGLRTGKNAAPPSRQKPGSSFHKLPDGELPQLPKAAQRPSKLIATYQYGVIDDNGNERIDFTKERREFTDGPGKTFRIFDQNQTVKKASGTGGTAVYNVKGIHDAVRAGLPVAVGEGEKVAAAATKEGLACTTTHRGGAKPPTIEDYGRTLGFLKKAVHITVLADNDKPGFQYAAGWLNFLVAGLGIDRDKISVVRCPGDTPKADLVDHLEAGGTLDTMEDVPDELLASPSASDTNQEPEFLSWEPVDLTDVLSGNYVVPVPTVLPRSDGACMLYPGKTHSVSGESESGKSIIAQFAAANVIKSGGRVLYIDFESDHASIAGRLQNMFGLSPAQIKAGFHYMRPEVAPTTTDMEAAAFARRLAETWDLVVFDGVTEALTLTGADSNSSDEYTAWFRAIVRPFESTGAAVVLIDHVTKSSESRGRFAIGSQAKLSVISGASYIVNVVSPLGIGRAGKLSIQVAKDRPGGVRGICGPANASRLQEAAVFTVDSTGSVPVMTLAPWNEDGSKHDPIRAAAMDIAEWLEEEQEAKSKRSIYEEMKGHSRAVIDSALNALQRDGYLKLQPGIRKSMMYSSLRAFTATDPLSTPTAKAANRQAISREAIPGATAPGQSNVIAFPNQPASHAELAWHVFPDDDWEPDQTGDYTDEDGWETQNEEGDGPKAEVFYIQADGLRILPAGTLRHSPEELFTADGDPIAEDELLGPWWWNENITSNTPQTLAVRCDEHLLYAEPIDYWGSACGPCLDIIENTLRDRRGIYEAFKMTPVPPLPSRTCHAHDGASTPEPRCDDCTTAARNRRQEIVRLDLRPDEHYDPSLVTELEKLLDRYAA